MLTDDSTCKYENAIECPGACYLSRGGSYAPAEPPPASRVERTRIDRRQWSRVNQD